MVWHFIGVYITNRTLHGRLEIRNFSFRVEKNLPLTALTQKNNKTEQNRTKKKKILPQ